MRYRGLKRNATICGLRALDAQLDTRVERIEETSWFDPVPQYFDGPTETRARFTLLLTEADYNRHETLFPLGEGHFAEHYLGPSDVCKYCGTAWLPGTFSCPNCGGETDHFDKALEYHTANCGIITHKTLRCEYSSVATLEVEALFTGPLRFTNNDFFETFKHSLWGNAPALWVCRFCGHVVKGHTSSCPGCGGNRAPVKHLATQKRLCVYCGRESVGNYACTHCNMRLMAN